MDKFLKHMTYEDWIMKKQKIWTISSKEIESVIKNTPTQKNPKMRWLHWWSLPFTDIIPIPIKLQKKKKKKKKKKKQNNHS